MVRGAFVKSEALLSERALVDTLGIILQALFSAILLCSASLYHFLVTVHCTIQYRTVKHKMPYASAKHNSSEANIDLELSSSASTIYSLIGDLLESGMSCGERPSFVKGLFFL